MFNRDTYIKSPLEYEAELLGLLDKSAVKTIFDIGACEAEDSIRYSLLFPHATVYAFEPRADNLAIGVKLAERYDCPNIQFENIALSDKNGHAEFFLSEGEPEHLKNSEEWNFGNKSSSLLPPSAEITSRIAWLQFNKTIQVQTMRLKDYVNAKNIPDIDLAHIDVQCAELMVLRGAGDFLAKIKLVWMEVEAVELYQSQPLKRDVEEFMTSNNFTNVLDTVGEMAGDQLYVNRDYFDATLLQRKAL